MKRFASVVLAGAVAVVPLVVAAPAAQAHHVTCFLEAIGPYRASSEGGGPIGYGAKVACTPTAPEKRRIEVTLWRYDFQRNTYYKHGVQADNDPTQPEKTMTYFAPCSDEHVLYSFHTEAVLFGVHGNEVDTSDNSDEWLGEC